MRHALTGHSSFQQITTHTTRGTNIQNWMAISRTGPHSSIALLIVRPKQQWFIESTMTTLDGGHLNNGVAIYLYNCAVLFPRPHLTLIAMPPARTSTVKSGPNPTRSSPRKAAPSKANDVRTSSSTSQPTLPAEVSASAPSRVIRPPQGWIPPRTSNAFFMFRSWRSKQDKANGTKVGQQQIMSKSYSEEWGDMSDEEKKPYFTLFNKADVLFKKRFPWYSYASKGREINKALPRLRVNWTPHTDHLFVIDRMGAVVYDTTAVPLTNPSVPLTQHSAKVNVPAPRHVSLAAPVQEEDVAMGDVFPPSSVAFPAVVLPYAEEDHSVDSRSQASVGLKYMFSRESSPSSFAESDTEMDYYLDVGRLAPKRWSNLMLWTTRSEARRMNRSMSRLRRIMTLRSGRTFTRLERRRSPTSLITRTAQTSMI
ncbi:hypothetical protein BDZ89DRAFT_119744 [Hymenopellis radicata]|nr:hypothetical protein BDZ89DRAFT_119744 [Hymenopellis radicata]